MSDAEKPFEATPRRLQKARNEGNVARAGELGANVGFGAAIAATAAVVPFVGALARAAIGSAAGKGRVPVTSALAIAALALVPIAFCAAAASVATLAQNGGVHVTFALRLERLNPLEGLKRMLSRETASHALRASAACAVTVAAIAVAAGPSALALLRASTPPALAAAAWSVATRTAWIACAVGALFAVAEYAAARKAWLRKLRMSFDERRREVKEEEGDPSTRGRRRALHRSLVRGCLADVKKASFVVANPTHVAVALRYAPPEFAVPCILVRAAGDAARRVRALAAEHGIPVVENVALARSLFFGSRAGEPIDVAHYVAVAEIVAALMRAKRLKV